MRNPCSPCVLIALLFAVIFTGCSQREAPLQSAIRELRRLGDSTQVGTDYSSYTARVAAAKTAIASALERSDDVAAKSRIENALHYYVEAEAAWKGNGEDVNKRPRAVDDYWIKAQEATERAAQFATADLTQRETLRDEEMDSFNAALRASELARKESEEARRKREVARLEAAEQKVIAEAAERERVRRFAPEGTVYAAKRISLTTPDGIISIPAGAELKTISKPADGMVRVQRGDLEVEVQEDDVTSDRDLVAALRTPAQVNHAMRNASRQVHSTQVPTTAPAK